MTQTLTTEQMNSYADRGGRDAWPTLDEQATYTINLATTFMAELIATGMSETMLDEMIAKQKEGATLFGTRREAQVDSQLATGGESIAMTNIKAYFYKMGQVLPMVTRGVKLDDLKPEHVIPPHEGGKSTAKAKARLDAMRPLVVRLDDKLKRYFGGQSAVEHHDKLAADIQTAQGNQATKQQARSPETFKLHVAKGQLLEMIEDINRFGRIAFMGRAEIAGKFNKDILLKARRAGKHRQAASVSESDAKATTPSTTTTPSTPA